MNPGIWIVLFFFLLAAQEPAPPQLDPKVAAAVEANIQLRKEAFWLSCRTAAVERASTFVDSILLAQAPMTSEDTLAPPPRPDRPILDPTSIEDDTFPLRPILPVRKEGK